MAEQNTKANIQDAAKLEAFMSSAVTLIIDSNSSSRPTLRKVLGDFGGKSANVHVADSYDDAVRMIESLKPTFVFADYLLGKNTALELFQVYTKAVPNRLQGIFIVLASDNSPAISSAAGEADVDALLVRPLTYNDVRDKFVEVVSSKVAPSDYVKMLEAGRRFLEQDKPDSALKAFLVAQRMDPKPGKACFYEGMVRRKQGDQEAALRCFERGLSLQPNHYRCLLGVFEIYMEQKKYDKAYEAGIALTDHHPLNPQRIPELIRLCILNEKFTEVLRFAGAVSMLDHVDDAINKYVVAGLFICGKHLLKLGQKDEAVKVLKKTELLAKGKASVIREIIVTLYAAGLSADAEEILHRAPKEVSESDEVRLSILEALDSRGVEAKVFLLSQELIRKGVKTPRLFEISIRQAKGLGRPTTVMQDLILRGASAFPDQREMFEKLAAG